MYKDICTVYSKYIEPKTQNTFYFRTVLRGVQWSSGKGANVIKSGIASADALTVYIRPSCANKSFLSPVEFAKRTNDKMGEFWTLKNQDIIVKGDIPYEYSPGENPLQILQKDYDDVFVITNVDDRRVGSPQIDHFEVWGK